MGRLSGVTVSRGAVEQEAIYHHMTPAGNKTGTDEAFLSQRDKAGRELMHTIECALHLLDGTLSSLKHRLRETQS